MSEAVPVAVPVQRVGADEAVAALYREQWVPMVRLACLLVDRQAEAEELVQDAFLRLHRAWDRLDDETSAPGYLRATVVNAARSHIRRRVMARRLVPAGDGHAGSPEDTAIVSEEHREAVRALRALPGRQRECLALRFYLDLSDAEIARTTGLALGSVKTHIRRGLAAIARALEARA